MQWWWVMAVKVLVESSERESISVEELRDSRRREMGDGRWRETGDGRRWEMGDGGRRWGGGASEEAEMSV